MKTAPRFSVTSNIATGVVIIGNEQFLKLLIRNMEAAERCDDTGSVEHAFLVALKAQLDSPSPSGTSGRGGGNAGKGKQ